MLGGALRRPKQQTVASVHLPAPLGGLNTVSGGTAMPPSDCIHSYNLVAAEHGLRTRLGYVEWCTGLSGSTTDSVRSILPFKGSQQNGSGDRLFACTQTGIWNVTSSTDTTPQVAIFPNQAGDAGWGVSCVVSTPGGRFLVYCDEENGAYVYGEVSSTWTKVVAGTTQLWEPATTYAFGNEVVNNGNVYTATVGGESAASGGPTGTGTGIADGGVTWDYVSAAPANAIGPSLGDQQQGLTLDPDDLAFCVVWKSRLWLVEKDTSRGWYLDVNSLYGTATSFDFGARMRAGGSLVGLYNWSYDGGAGMDTSLVGISQAGDIVIYQGTDPTSADTFGLKGTWFVGGVPLGRRIATDYGGDLLVASLLGVLPLSRLVVGTASEERSQYATAKIANLFNQLAVAYRVVRGWSLVIHPTDNALLVTVPTAADQPTEQLVMSLATKGWSRYRDLPILSAESWDGELYFGTADGRVCRNSGYVDNVQLSNPDVSTAIEYSLLTSYQNLGNARQKRVQLIRPTVLSDSSAPSFRAAAKYNFDLAELAAIPATAPTPGEGLWNTGVWDESPWLGELVATQTFSGAFGMGREVAIGIRGTAISRTTLVGMDVYFEQGGLL